MHYHRLEPRRGQARRVHNLHEIDVTGCTAHVRHAGISQDRWDFVIPGYRVIKQSANRDPATTKTCTSEKERQLNPVALGGSGVFGLMAAHIS
jgi:hypothetical protein